MEEEDQPLYIDDSEKTIKCHWCTTFKGSQEVKHVNQHTLKSSSHCNARKRFFGISEENRSRGENQLDIRDFFTCTRYSKHFTYKEWKHQHPLMARKLQSLADQPLYYVCCPEEVVNVPDDSGTLTQYTGTIRALRGAPMGECTGGAMVTGTHPYICDPCDALVHGKSSPLLRIEAQP